MPIVVWPVQLLFVYKQFHFHHYVIEFMLLVYVYSVGCPSFYYPGHVAMSPLRYIHYSFDVCDNKIGLENVFLSSIV